MRYLFSALVLSLLAAPARAEDWPQWLGPLRTGATTRKIEPWKELPKPLWTADIAEGHSSPIAADGKVFLHTMGADNTSEVLTAWSADGKQVWTAKYAKDAFKTPFGNGPRATPCYADGRVYAFGITGVLVCVDAKDGKIVWQVDTLKTFGSKNLFFGISSSPAIVGDTVVVMVGGKGAGIVAFDRKTGKRVWTATDDAASYAAPSLASDSKSIVTLSGSHLRAISADGKPLWEKAFKDLINESSTTPVLVGDAVIASSVTLGAIGVRATKDGDGYKVEEIWRNTDLTCYFSTPIVLADSKHMLLVKGRATLRNATADLVCVEIATGKVMWTREKIGTYHASLTRLADGNLLLLDDSGSLALIEGNAKEYKELARGSVAKAKGDLWASPAFLDGKVLIRNKNELMAFELK